LLAAEEVSRFVPPKVALLSHSSFGSHKSRQARKMAEALQLIRQRAPDLEVDGEMRGDAALSEELRSRVFLHSPLKGAANLLIMPNADAANISHNLLKEVTNSVSVGTDHPRFGQTGAHSDPFSECAADHQYDRDCHGRCAGISAPPVKLSDPKRSIPIQDFQPGLSCRPVAKRRKSCPSFQEIFSVSKVCPVADSPK
jgi:hypothetical protein